MFYEIKLYEYLLIVITLGNIYKYVHIKLMQMITCIYIHINFLNSQIYNIVFSHALHVK